MKELKQASIEINNQTIEFMKKIVEPDPEVVNIGKAFMIIFNYRYKAG